MHVVGPLFQFQILWSFSAYFSYPLNISNNNNNNNNNISFFKLLPSTRRTFHYRLCILITSYFSPLYYFLYSPQPMVSGKSLVYIPLHPRARRSFLHCPWLKIIIIIIIIIVFCRSFSLRPSSVIYAIYLGSTHMLPSASRSFPHCLWPITVYYLCPLL